MKYSILVNRSPVGYFSPQKGIRGDPLFPFLFSSCHGRPKQDIRVGTNDYDSVSVSHLLDAEDTFFFCEVKKLEMQYGNVTVLLFEALSGVHISISRSVNEVAIVDKLAGILDYGICFFPQSIRSTHGSKVQGC